jgi:hypothetical protein
MEMADLRKRIRREIDLAKEDAEARRRAADAGKVAYATLLDHVIVPLLKQVVTILRSEGWGCQTFTPAGSARLVSDRSSDEFIEFDLDTSAGPHLTGRVSLARGRQGMLVDEQIIAASKPLDDINEDDVLAFLLPAIRRLAGR